MITMSGLDRLDNCSASDLLPRVDESASIYSKNGTAVHAYLDAIASGVVPKVALAAVPVTHQEACAAIDLTKVPHSQVGAWRSEMAFAFDWKHGKSRVLDVKAREYGLLTVWEIPGTADLIGLDPDGETVWVLDVKTGRRWLGQPRDSLQLLGYAVAAALALGRTRAMVGFLYVRKDDDPKLIVEEIDDMDLIIAQQRITRIMERAAFKKQFNQVEPVAGDHCTYCPCYRGCPAHTAMLEPILTKHLDKARGGLLGKGEVRVIELEDIPVALERVKLIEDMAGRLKKELEDAVRAHGAIQLKDGRVLAEVETEREKLDPELARPVLETFFVPELVNEAIETKVTLTKESIKKLVNMRAADTKEKKGALTESILEAVRAAGGITTNRYYSVQCRSARSLPAKK